MHIVIYLWMFMWEGALGWVHVHIWAHMEVRGRCQHLFHQPGAQLTASAGLAIITEPQGPLVPVFPALGLQAGVTSPGFPTVLGI